VYFALIKHGPRTKRTVKKINISYVFVAAGTCLLSHCLVSIRVLQVHLQTKSNYLLCMFLFLKSVNWTDVPICIRIPQDYGSFYFQATITLL
jgi:hypothetical protein